MSLDDWAGLLAGQRTSGAEVVLQAPIREAGRGGSGAFLGRAHDGIRYWIKPLNNLQGERVPITEQIVARAGQLIGAPVCTPRTIEIPEELATYQYCYSRALVPSIAHGSTAVEKVTEIRTMNYRNEDENHIRHAYIFALYDWCWGGDEQWLVDLSDEYRYYSHDHGHYFPPESPTWSRDTLGANVDVEHPLRGTVKDVSLIAVGGVVSALRSVTREQIRDILIKIPSEWPVSDSDLEAVGYFLEHRAPIVADRLERRFRLQS